MAIEGLGQTAAYNPYAGMQSGTATSAGSAPSASNAVNAASQTANNTLTSVVSDTSGVISDKMMQIALIYEMVAEADGTDEQGSNMFLQMLLQNILFGSEGATPLSPTEQAAMINEVISSGQPGSVARAMGQSTGGGAQGATYGAGGMMSMGGAIGGMISTAA